MNESATQRLEAKILDAGTLAAAAARWHAAKRRLVSTNGCFDVLHWGHIHSLLEARAMGEFLVVGVNSDRAVRALKGNTRPHFPEAIRLRQLAALECVDAVVIFDDETPARFLEQLRPQVHVKGADYRGKEIPELALMKRWGGEVRFVDLVPGVSTTHLLESSL